MDGETVRIIRDKLARGLQVDGLLGERKATLGQAVRPGIEQRDSHRAAVGDIALEPSALAK